MRLCQSLIVGMTLGFELIHVTVNVSFGWFKFVPVMIIFNLLKVIFCIFAVIIELRWWVQIHFSLLGICDHFATRKRGKKQEKLEDSLEESARHSGFGGPAATVAHSTLYLEEVDSASSMIQMDRDSPLMGFLIHENQETWPRGPKRKAP